MDIWLKYGMIHGTRLFVETPYIEGIEDFRVSRLINEHGTRWDLHLLSELLLLRFTYPFEFLQKN